MASPPIEERELMLDCMDRFFILQNYRIDSQKSVNPGEYFTKENGTRKFSTFSL